MNKKFSLFFALVFSLSLVSCSGEPDWFAEPEKGTEITAEEAFSLTNSIYSQYRNYTNKSFQYANVHGKDRGSSYGSSAWNNKLSYPDKFLSGEGETYSGDSINASKIYLFIKGNNGYILYDNNEGKTGTVRETSSAFSDFILSYPGYILIGTRHPCYLEQGYPLWLQVLERSFSVVHQPAEYEQYLPYISYHYFSKDSKSIYLDVEYNGSYLNYFHGYQNEYSYIRSIVVFENYLPRYSYRYEKREAMNSSGELVCEYYFEETIAYDYNRFSIKYPNISEYNIEQI